MSEQNTPSEMTFREALLSMCYREVQPGQWCKPVGFHLFVFSEAKNLWENWFKGGDGKLHCWESKTLVTQHDLKTAEAYTRAFTDPTGSSDFALAAVDI